MGTHFAYLPIKLLMPSSFDCVKEISLKTIPSATKIDIKRVVESLYGFEVEKVHTLNMGGKKKKRGGLLIAKPHYKKAYVTLKKPVSLSQDLYPVRMIEDDKRSGQSKSSIVEEAEVKSHWFDWRTGDNKFNPENQSSTRGSHAHRGERDSAPTKFSWSSMRSS